MRKELQILTDHGKQFITDLRNQPVSERFRGRPVISAGIRPEEIEAAAAMCPTAAIDSHSGSIDLGRCTFCNECALAVSEAYRFTNDYRIAATRREDLVIKPGQADSLRIDETAVRKEIRRLFRRSLKLRQVSAGGDNSCEMELGATGNVNFDMGRYGIEFVASPRHADGI
ncbi:MAG: NADH:ubiquinone oxidoreductase, partial [Bacteroidales bacterium]|nr:NADH:ubiquinone oxidoreductase [Bacteroidales bacterium]